MKKALQSIVLLGAATGVAQAATSVTLYGLVDGGIGYTETKISKGDNWTKERNVGLLNGVKNGNRWGLKGSEELGGGTSAIFQIESGFDLGTGKSKQEGRLFGRKAIIGLKGDDWGTLTLGRQYNVADDIVSGIDPFGTGVLQAGVTDGAFGDSVSARMDNSIKYMAPDFGGFKFGLAYSGTHKETTSEIDKLESEERNTSNWLSTGLGFENGPVSVGLSYDRFRTDVRSRGHGLDPKTGKIEPFDKKTTGTTHMWNLFGAYDFEAVKLHLGYGQIRGSVGNPTVAGAGVGGIGLTGKLSAFGYGYTLTNGYRQQSWMAGLSAPVGDSGVLLFSYQGNKTKNTGEAFDGIKGDLNIFSLGYIQNLSKRTNVYAAASYGSGKLKFDDRNEPNVKLKSTLVGVGLQHRF